MSAYVYLLRCADDTLYTGWTNDIARRLARHQAGRGAKYTRARLPVRLAYYEELTDATAARKREYVLRHLPRRTKQALIAQADIGKLIVENGEKMLQDLKVSAFLDELASSSPAPGGGSVAALAGAMAAALVSMVCNLTVGNDKYKDAEAIMRQTVVQAEQLRTQLTALMEQDTNAYSAVIASYRLPKDTDEQKTVRSAAIQAALKQAVEVPLAIAEAAAPLHALAQTAQQHGNPNAASDAYVAQILADTAIKAALANADINLPSIKDADYVAASRVRITALQKL